MLPWMPLLRISIPDGHGERGLDTARNQYLATLCEGNQFRMVNQRPAQQIHVRGVLVLMFDALRQNFSQMTGKKPQNQIQTTILENYTEADLQ